MSHARAFQVMVRDSLRGHFPLGHISPGHSPAGQFPSLHRTFPPAVKAKIWKLALYSWPSRLTTWGPDPNRPTTWGPNPNRPTGRGII